MKKGEQRHWKLTKTDKVVYTILFCILLISSIGIVISGRDYRTAAAEYDALEQYVTPLDAENTLRWNIDWDALYKINPDIIAWIVVPDTKISYPIVQTKDNETYLHQTFTGTKNSCGSIFMDCLNRADFGDPNTVIYGHNMRNGSMFRALNDYKEESFYKEHKEVWICTPSWQRQYQIISVHLTQDGSDTYTKAFPEGGYEAHIGSEVSQSIYDTGNSYDVSRTMVTLSTCNGSNSDRRMVLVCQPAYEIRISD